MDNFFKYHFNKHYQTSPTRLRLCHLPSSHLLLAGLWRLVGGGGIGSIRRSAPELNTIMVAALHCTVHYSHVQHVEPGPGDGTTCYLRGHIVIRTTACSLWMIQNSAPIGALI